LEPELTNAWGALRRRILTPNVSATKLDVRGFHRKSPAAAEQLEAVGASFLVGYGYAAEAATPDAATERLEQVPRPFRGFAYEGAAMGFAIRDGLPLGSHRQVEQFLAGAGAPHIYMAYVGIGWAMARLPKFRWPRADRLDPLLRWLVLDGYGFHQAYFRTKRYVHDHYQDPDFSWPAGPERWYANRALDQGIGRACWFVGGTDPDVVADLLDAFPADRRADLYSGAGLAATYAGAADEAELTRFRQRAGAHRPQVAQASAFAAEARVRAGLLVGHTAVATTVFCGMTPEQAARTSAELQPAGPVAAGLVAYEVWRQRLANEFVSLGRC
jgi:hypothetical protein